MNNFFASALPLDVKYDLKGSTLGRSTRGLHLDGKPREGRLLVGPGDVILKDLDLNVCFKLEEGWHERCALLWLSVHCWWLPLVLISNSISLVLATYQRMAVEGLLARRPAG